MARSRETDSAASRLPPPPRMTGVGLTQVALFGGLIAVALAFLGVFMATSGPDPSVLRRVDSMGMTVLAAITSPEPEWWDQHHSTSTGCKLFLEKYYKELPLEYKSPATRKRLSRVNNDQRVANKKRLENLENALGSLNTSTVRGIQLFFTKRARNIRAGASIKETSFSKVAGGFGDIEVGVATATTADGSGTFAARVYRRPYTDLEKKRQGTAYVILSQAAIDASAGGGMWVFLTPLLVLVGIGLILFAANTASAGMKSLARDLDTIARGKLDTRIRLTTGSGEIGYLQRMAERMTKALQTVQPSEPVGVDEAVEKEMSLAGEIHESLRPSEAPRVPGYEIETLFKAGSEIGGDYYDYIELDENRLVLIIADCSESLRGVPAAMVMAMTRAYLKAAIDSDSGPADWLRWVNRRLARDLRSGMAVTALIVVLDQSKGAVTAASAGHRPIILWRKGKTATINPNGIALGLDVGPVFDKTLEEKRFAMAKGDRIVFYTDGLVTAENAEGDTFGDERLMESVRKQGAMNSSAFVNFVAGGLDKFLDGAEQADDITISTLKKMK